MNGRDKRRQRAAKARAREAANSICLNCGQKRRHFIPPSFGEPGFFACAPRSSSLARALEGVSDESLRDPLRLIDKLPDLISGEMMMDFKPQRLMTRAEITTDFNAEQYHELYFPKER